MAGHVFIIRSDLTKLFCDAWLMPTDYSLDIREHWLKEIPGLKKGWHPGPRTPEWMESKSRVMEVRDWPDGEPRPWLVRTGKGRDTEVQWFVEGVQEFFQKVVPIVKERRFTGRAKPLLALPVPGTGAGGAREKFGEVLAYLLPALLRAGKDHDVDIALVVKDGEDFTAAINKRKYLERNKGVWFDELSGELKEKGRELSARAIKGGLVLFVGAGVSAGAALPDWNQLLECLAGKAGVFQNDRIPPEKMRRGFEELTKLDQARLIADYLNERNIGAKNCIGGAVSELINEHRHYCLAHATLAALPVNEVVTTNYDVLFELASEYAQGAKPAVLPYSPSKPGERWILKLHGCVTQPQDIVLTRSDYIRYDERRAALKGIVQALLITRHMLFVGFSLADDNFHRIIEDVRKAVRGERRTGNHEVPFGTALAPSPNHFVEKLWKGDVNWVSFKPEENPEAYRLQEIFLDFLASESITATNHLMDPKFDGVLTEGERGLRLALEKLIEGADEKIKRTPAWNEVETLMKRFGRKV